MPAQCAVSSERPAERTWSPPGQATVPALDEGSFQTPGSHGLWVLRAPLQGRQESHGGLEAIFSALLHLLKSFCSRSLSRTCWSNTEGDFTLWAITPGMYLTPLTRCVPLTMAHACPSAATGHHSPRLWSVSGVPVVCFWGPCWSSSCLPVAACS